MTGSTSSYSALNLNNNSEFHLNFGDNPDLVFKALVDETLTSPSQGQIAFRISKDKAKLILESPDNIFTITLISKADNTESLLYTGQWVSSAEYASVISAGEDAAAAVSNEILITQLRQQVTALTEANTLLRGQIRQVNGISSIQREDAANLNAGSAF